MGRSTAVGDEGAAEDQVSGGRIRDRGSVWALKGSCITFPHVLHPTPTQRCCPAPTTTISKPPPQESKGAEPEASALVVGGELAPGAPSSAVSQALEVAIPTHMAPLCLQLGASKGCANAGLRDAVMAIYLTCCHLCTHAQRPFGGEVGVYLLC